MKLSTILTCVLLMSVPSLASQFKNHHEPHVRVLSKKMDVLYLSIPKDLMGAEIEVFSETGEKIVSTRINHHKILVDFYNETQGHYTIRISNGKAEESLDYYKCEPSPVAPDQLNATDMELINIALLKKKVEWRYA